MIKRIISVLTAIFFSLWLASGDGFEWEPFIGLFSAVSAYLTFEIIDRKNQDPKNKYTHKKKRGRVKTKVEKDLLIYLSKNDGTPPAMIAEEMKINELEVKHTCDELESKGFIYHPWIHGYDTTRHLTEKGRAYLVKNKLFEQNGGHNSGGCASST